ncbi:glycosyltransferase [Marinilabilia salmonicolor]|uniref:Glycosyltransferase involved in cell wall biosynthesis n=1 Tax=Marinilabilia salmonicolor TaxID=989 RepID=A0A2T0XLM6_9BACT|nr:glycosyltransferase [Marinilabilia salmonicolor]PRY99822.1 glycosyltransferase involved in cell wall biosynthesis [Marinilabilia salmonicolor]RCW37381.1 glycosyltransferase involved in cell wall biosynthesis [Marinilabilia salmonicolor]
MRVLMFGWEFPPHISGGLGTACFGLTRGLSYISGLQVLFVVPKAFGDEEQQGISLIGANQVPVKHRKLNLKHFSRKLDYIEVGSRMMPYTDPDEYFRIEKSKKEKGAFEFVQTDEAGQIPFTGTYGANLLKEIHDYALVANVIAQDYSFDLIHAHDWLTYPAGIAAKEATGKPLVIHVHATDFDRSGGSVNPVVFDIEKRGMEAADKIIAVSNLTRRTVIEKYGIDAEKVVTVYNAVEPLEKKDKPAFQKGTNEKVVTFLGRITMQKGPEYFVEAAHRVLQKNRNVRFVMAGSGDMMHKMVRRAAQLKIMDKFHFTGFLRGEEVFSMLAMSDLYVMPSVSEPFGISPLEAMQSNVPVLISHQSGVAEILTYAIKTNFWDVDAMADAIYGVLHYPALSEMFVKYGKKEVDALKWEKSALDVKMVYDSVLNEFY